MTASKRLYAAVPAEQMVPGFSAELVVLQLALTDQLAKGVGLDDHAPPPGLGTKRAVTLRGTRAQINIHFIADRSAVTTSNVCFLHS
jgi:hypothetical protein